MKIFIESRVCKELGLSYDSPGSESTIETENFVEAWNRLCVTKESITTDGFKDPTSRNVPFSTFIDNHKSNKMNLVNKGSGYFELK